MSDAIYLTNITYRWPGAEQSTLDIPVFRVADQEAVFLLGSSGSGKSTLLKLIAGLLLPDTGQITILGERIDNRNNRSRDAYRARHIGFVFQQFNLVPYLDVYSNIELAARLAHIDQSTFKASLEELIDSLSLPENILRQRADQLSAGQQQRVAIARALIKKPGVIIADEPTSALDQDARDDFVELLLKVRARTRASVLFVSHDRQLIPHFDSVQEIRQLNRVGSPFESEHGAGEAIT